jgi:hypothetical protein
VINVKSFSVYSGVMNTFLFREADKQKLIKGNHRSRRAKNAGILYCPLHTTWRAGIPSLPHNRKND